MPIKKLALILDLVTNRAILARKYVSKRRNSGITVVFNPNSYATRFKHLFRTYNKINSILIYKWKIKSQISYQSDNLIAFKGFFIWVITTPLGQISTIVNTQKKWTHPIFLTIMSFKKPYRFSNLKKIQISVFQNFKAKAVLIIALQQAAKFPVIRENFFLTRKMCRKKFTHSETRICDSVVRCISAIDLNH